MSLTLAQGHSIATMLAVAAVAILLTGAFYHRAFGTLPPRSGARCSACGRRRFCWS